MYSNYILVTTLKRKFYLAGVVSFELTGAGIKIRCVNHFATPQKNQRASEYNSKTLCDRTAVIH